MIQTTSEPDLAIAWSGAYSRAMSTVTEVKAATKQLSPQDQWELYRWLGEAENLRQFRLEELRREIAVGIEQADRGETAPLDVQTLKDEVHRRSATNRSN